MAFKDAEGCAEALGHFESNYGDFSLAFKQPELWRAVDEEGCKSAACRFFDENERVVVVAKE